MSAQMEFKAMSSRLAYVGSRPGVKDPSRDSDSWYTPACYLDAARKVLGGIDLDPFSSYEANRKVRATQYLTVSYDSIANEWPKARTVWMNPPYSAGLCGKAAERFIDQYKKGRFDHGIVLVNNATDTKWFKVLAQHAAAVAFTDHRISFWNADGKAVSGNTRGQCFLLFTTSKRKIVSFRRAFQPYSSLLMSTGEN